MKIVKTIEYSETEFAFYMVGVVILLIALMIWALKLFGK